VGLEIGPALASECVDDGRWSDDWRILTGDVRMWDDEEWASVSPEPQNSRGSVYTRS